MLKNATDNILKSEKKDTPFSRFTDKWIHVILAFLCASVLMLLVYYCFDIIPFGGRTVLRMDLFHQYGPLFAELYDRLTDFKSFLYSWNTGGGGAFLGNYFNYLSSPVGDLIALIAGHNNIPEAIGTMVLIKNALAASALAYYLKKKFNRNDFSITAFGLLYSFCGFFIAYYWNVMWIDAMYLLPLVILGIEQIVNDRKCKLYVGALAFSFFANYYMSYMICVFAVLYFLVHFISTSKFNDCYSDIPSSTDEDGNIIHSTLNKVIYNKFIRSGFLFGASSVVAVCLVAFALIPTYLCLKSCSATSGTFPTDLNLYNNIFDFLANHLASLEPTIRSSGDTVLPNVYCGMLTVLLIPLYLFCDKIPAKSRIAHVVFLGVFFAGFNVNSVNYILHAFHFPNDLPFRFSFIYSFLLVTMGFEVLTHIREFSSKAIIASGVGVIGFVILVERLGMDNVDDSTVYVSIGFTALYVLVLCLMRKKDYAQSAVCLLLLCSVFAEVAVADTDHFLITQEKVNFVNGYNEFRTLKEELDQKEGTDKYRLEVTDINTLMDASWYDYNGISVFSSMAYERSANLQNQLGLDSNYINSYIYYSQTPIYNAMMGLKYLVRNDDYSIINPELFSYSGECGKFTAYSNKYYLPIAFAVNNEMTSFDSTKDNPFDVQNDLWYYATGIGNALKPIKATNYEAENIIGSDEYLTDYFTCIKSDDDGEGTLKIDYTVPENQNIYVYFDSSDVDTINVSTSGGDFNKDQGIDEPYILDCGACSKDETLTIEVKLGADVSSATASCYVYGLNKDVLDAGYEVLNHNTLNITDFEETYIKGTINLADGKMLYTSINYDDGWKVYVDGKEVKKSAIAEALIGVKMEAGTHTVEFKYTPRGLVVGGIISASTVLLLAIFFILKKVLKKKSGSEFKKTSKVTDFIEDDTNKAPTGIDAMMAEDLGEDATVEDAEALLAPVDEFEGQLEKNVEGLSRADELLNTQKLDLKEILGDLDNTEEDK